MKECKKHEYVAPELTSYGEVRTITAGGGCPAPLDQTFPTDTPFDELTCS